MTAATSNIVPLAEANRELERIGHYLGPSRRGRWCWVDEYGVMIWATPTSRRLPVGTWLELVRWCLCGTPNGGSRQWARWRKWALRSLPSITTFVSYSDPSVGHTGALYRACNWQWAPTWHRLRPPPTGNGEWATGRRESVKDRWVFNLRDDSSRSAVIAVRDRSLVARGIPSFHEFSASGAV